MRFDPGDQRLRAVETEDGPAAGIRVQQVGEAGFDAGGFVEKGERAAEGRQVPGQALAVSGGLNLDFGERLAGFFRFHDARGVPVGIEEIVREAVARGKGEFADGDAAAGFDVDAVAILDQPTGGG